jgi:hypothetical protein
VKPPNAASPARIAGHRVALGARADCRHAGTYRLLSKAVGTDCGEIVANVASALSGPLPPPFYFILLSRTSGPLARTITGRSACHSHRLGHGEGAVPEIDVDQAVVAHPLDTDWRQ